MFFLGAKRTKNARHTGFASHSRSLLVPHYVSTRSNVVCRLCLPLWQHRLVASREAQPLAVLLTTNCWRYCRFAKQICSYSSIGTDTRCCSNGAGFLFDITFCRWIPRIAKTVPLFKEGRAKRREITSHGFSISYPLRVLPLSLKRKSFFLWEIEL